jgi:WhiB family redox-sensing transcriptional regulator
MALAKCEHTEPSLFFSHDEIGVREAQRICATCPVRLACLGYALDNNLTGGVWGGTSEQERQRILIST